MVKLTGSSYVKIALVLALGAVLIAFSTCSGPWFSMGRPTNIGNASVNASDVENLAVKWAAGSVTIEVVDNASDTIELVETSQGGFSRAQQMRWSVSGGTLDINYGSWFSCASLSKKDLEVRIPKKYADSLGKVRLDGASGDYRVQGIGCESLDLKLASGRADAQEVSAKALSVDLASGQLSATGRFAESVDVQTASGTASVTCKEVAPRAIDADLASGRVTVAIPENDGFTAKVDKSSGSFSSAFPTTQQGNGYVYGNGGASINVRIASGEFVLDKTSR